MSDKIRVYSKESDYSALLCTNKAVDIKCITGFNYWQDFACIYNSRGFTIGADLFLDTLDWYCKNNGSGCLWFCNNIVSCQVDSRFCKFSTFYKKDTGFYELFILEKLDNLRVVLNRLKKEIGFDTIKIASIKTLDRVKYLFTLCKDCKELVFVELLFDFYTKSFENNNVEHLFENIENCNKTIPFSFENCELENRYIDYADRVDSFYRFEDLEIDKVYFETIQKELSGKKFIVKRLKHRLAFIVGNKMLKDIFVVACNYYSK